MPTRPGHGPDLVQPAHLAGAHGSARARHACLGSVVAAGLLLQAPWLVAPFGFLELNAGYFFGPFAQSYERFGFAALRGIPLGPFEVWPESPDKGYCYFNHPPGTAWLYTALGSAEWQLRLPSVLATIAAGLLLALLLLRRQGPWAAAVGGIALQAFPALAFGSQLSYEPPVLALGLLLFFAADPEGPPRRGASLLVLLAAAVGPWLDWSFGFFVLGLPLVHGQRRLREIGRRILVPWCLSLASLLLVLAWMRWAKAAAFVPQRPGQGEDVAAMLDRALFDRPGFLDFAIAGADQLAQGFGLWTLALAAAGAFVFGRQQPRLLLASMVPALLHPLVFAAHAMTHLMFWAHVAVPAAAGLAALAQQVHRERWRMTLSVSLLVLALGGTTLASIRLKQSGTAPIFASLGRALDAEATAARRDGASPAMVATNAFRSYPYYVASHKVYLGPVTDPALVENAWKGGAKIQFVYVAAELEDRHGNRAPLASPELLTWLERFPKRELPELQGRWPFGDDGYLSVRDAWAFEL